MPAGLLVDLPGERLGDRFARFEVAAHDIPGIREKLPLGRSLLEENTVVRAYDESGSDT
ncbi:hypothetical protein GCM10010435_62810 [Winogradskya consettensis]|uniref:Uncharacterized protein n=1 Tax=Winogradskya consettensis TaxID=113560 RepID=A0A919T101_9ACTN|nr:hypothetical protein Aco04nite_85530 [Actinoplanes consettensis]